MSAPDGDLESQARKHRGPLRGMFAVVLFALLLLGGLAIYAFRLGGAPEGAETQVQSGVGTVEGDAAGGVSANDDATEEAGTDAAPDPAAVTVEGELDAATADGGTAATSDTGAENATETTD